MVLSEREVLERDQQEHPGCNYSTSESLSCQTVNGETQCEKLRRIYRQCRGEPQKEIYTAREETKGGSELESRGGLGTMIIPFEGGEGNPFDIMGRMTRSLEDFFDEPKIFGGFGGFGFGNPFGRNPFEEFAGGQEQPETSRQPPRQRAAPHRFPRGAYNEPDTANTQEPQTAEPFRGGFFWNRRKTSPQPRNEELFRGYTGKVEEV